MNRMMHIIAAGVALSVAFLSNNVFGVDYYWIGTGGNSLWHTSGNWKGGVVPGSGEVVHFRPTPAEGATREVMLQSQVAGLTVIHVGNCTEDNPWVFDVADGNKSYGITCTDDLWLGYHSPGYLWIKSGIYNFNKSCNVGVNVRNGSYSAS